MEYKVQAMACFLSYVAFEQPYMHIQPITWEICDPSNDQHFVPAIIRTWHYSCIRVPPGVDNYKVARMVSFGKDKLVSEVEVCSTRSWNRVDVIPPPIKSMKWDCGYGICNGVAYWTMANQRDYLVLFDASNKIFQALLPPK